MEIEHGDSGTASMWLGRYGLVTEDKVFDWQSTKS